MQSVNTAKILAKIAFWGPSLLGILAIACVVNPTLAEAWYGVHLESYNSPERAAQGWEEIRRVHPDLAAAGHRVLRVELPEKGVYYRVIAGPFPTYEDALLVNESFGNAGRFTRVVAIDESSLAGDLAAPPALRPAPTATPSVAEMPPSPSSTAMTAGATAQEPVRSQSSSRLSKPSSKSSSKPLTESADAMRLRSNPLAAEAPLLAKTPVKSAKKKAAESKAPTSTANTASQNPPQDEKPNIEYRVKQPRSNPAPAKAKEEPIKTMVGNLPSEFGNKPKAAPSAPTQEPKSFLPYVGLGISF